MIRKHSQINHVEVTVNIKWYVSIVPQYRYFINKEPNTVKEQIQADPYRGVGVRSVIEVFLCNIYLRFNHSYPQQFTEISNCQYFQ